MREILKTCSTRWSREGAQSPLGDRQTTLANLAGYRRARLDVVRGNGKTAISGCPTVTQAQASCRTVTGPGADLPTSVAELWAHWRELPPTMTAEQLLDAGWFGLTRAPLYRAMGRGELPVVKLGRRTLILTVPLLRMLGIDLDRAAVDAAAGQASAADGGLLNVHDVADSVQR
jgi:hypothetical protein